MSSFTPSEEIEFCGIHLSIFFSGVFITLTCISVAGLRSRIQKSITNVFDRFHSRTKEFGDLGKVGPKEEVHACVDCIYVCCLFQCNSRPFEEQVMHRNFWNSYFTRTPLKRTAVFASLAGAWILFLLMTLFLSFALALIESVYCTPWKWLVTGFLVSFIYCTIPLIMISFIRLWIIYWDLSWVLGSPMEDFPESEQVYNVHDAVTRDFIAHSELPSIEGYNINRVREEDREKEKIKTNFLMASTVKRSMGHYNILEEERGQRGGAHLRHVKIVPYVPPETQTEKTSHRRSNRILPGSSSTQRRGSPVPLHETTRRIFVNHAPLSTQFTSTVNREEALSSREVDVHFEIGKSPSSPTRVLISTTSTESEAQTMGDNNHSIPSMTRVSEMSDASSSWTPVSATSTEGTSCSMCCSDFSGTTRSTTSALTTDAAHIPGSLEDKSSPACETKNPPASELFDIGAMSDSPQSEDKHHFSRAVPFGTHLAAVIQHHKNRQGY
mmetsp:Transcript_9782/g.36495  ORF Transcript_9782/g.36495 Transcript_9782/m.36495 type:complete len:497 (+) Transcript_9782:3279-4769(+)